MDLNPKFLCLAGLIIGINQPTVVVGTLSDDQRFPVFVLGLRILSEARKKSWVLRRTMGEIRIFKYKFARELSQFRASKLQL